MKTLEKIGIQVESIILFGSRARGDFTSNSDYDFLIVTKDTFTIKEKMSISKALREALAEIYIPADIIKSTDEVVLQKDKIGLVVRYAIKEVVMI